MTHLKSMSFYDPLKPVPICIYKSIFQAKTCQSWEKLVSIEYPVEHAS